MNDRSRAVKRQLASDSMKGWTMPPRCLIFLILIAQCSLPGCAHFPPHSSAAQRVQSSGTVNIAPKALVREITVVLEQPPMLLPIEQVQEGVIITGWKPYAGEWHVARRWQERTRFRIAIIPDWNAPTERSRLEATEETQTRAADGQRWEAVEALDRPQRSRDVLDFVLSRIGRGAGT